MFFFVSKILKVFLFPLTWIVILFILASIVKNKKWKRTCLIAAIALTVVFSDKPLLQWAEYMTTKKYSHQKPPKQYYNVAIVLGGFSDGFDTATTQMAYIDDRGARLWEAIRLYECGIVEKLLITGDAVIASSPDNQGTAAPFRRFLGDFGLHDDDLLLEQKARNTIENADFSIHILDSLHYSPEQCLLVTSAEHMRRSLNTFEAKGWPLDAYAVNIHPKPHPKAVSFIPSWKTITDWQKLINEWAGAIVYSIAN